MSMEPYKVIEVKNGDISHWKLIDFEGKTVWSSEFPKKQPPSDVTDSEIEEMAIKKWPEMISPIDNRDMSFTYREEYVSHIKEFRDLMRDRLNQSHREEMWISVDIPPVSEEPKFVNVLICLKWGVVRQGFFNTKTNNFQTLEHDIYEKERITHWMELPKPPRHSKPQNDRI